MHLLVRNLYHAGCHCKKKAESDKVLHIKKLTVGTQVSARIIAPGAAALGPMVKGTREQELGSGWSSQ